ncbi:hypothetical protein PBY51_021940 [Eleginops maclovinus]|uniref:Uncharacterized protein n=1 Tax=Eleginops maclovinus TaxID=56733 RepID=A0AAN7XE91_ELEMC|nr:hypothetical protein PBY51_021940 [Eleginops maclovinus]
MEECAQSSVSAPVRAERKRQNSPHPSVLPPQLRVSPHVDLCTTSASLNPPPTSQGGDHESRCLPRRGGERWRSAEDAVKVSEKQLQTPQQRDPD